MKRDSVKSSNVKSIGYDEVNSILEVEFQDGSIYQYYGIPIRIYSSLMKANSIGGYVDRYVKKARYTYKKIR